MPIKSGIHNSSHDFGDSYWSPCGILKAVMQGADFICIGVVASQDCQPILAHSDMLSLSGNEKDAPQVLRASANPHKLYSKQLMHLQQAIYLIQELRLSTGKNLSLEIDIIDVKGTATRPLDIHSSFLQQIVKACQNHWSWLTLYSAAIDDLIEIRQICPKANLGARLFSRRENIPCYEENIWGRSFLGQTRANLQRIMDEGICSIQTPWDSVTLPPLLNVIPRNMQLTITDNFYQLANTHNIQDVITHFMSARFPLNIATNKLANAERLTRPLRSARHHKTAPLSNDEIDALSALTSSTHG